MNYIGTKKLKTKRLILRQFRYSDNIDMFNNWANDPEVSKYLSWSTHKNPQESLEIINLWCDGYKNPDFFQWCIELNNQAIGSISVVSTKNNIAEIGFCLGKNFWNKGIMTEALLAVRDFLFNEVQYEILIGAHHILNPASGKVFLKSEFKRDEKMDNYEKYLKFDFKIIAYSYYKLG